jgi:hypothetical protein
VNYKVTIMFVPRDPDEETVSTSWEADYLNHNDAADSAVSHLYEGERIPETREKVINAQRDEGLSIIVQPLPQSDYDGPYYPPSGPRPTRDSRDPHGNIERELLANHTGEQGANQHEAAVQWKKAHPQFALEYLLKLQHLEREALEPQPRKDAKPT